MVCFPDLQEQTYSALSVSSVFTMPPINNPSTEVPWLGSKGIRSTKYFTVKKCVYLRLPATNSMGKFNVNTMKT
jgi:hypothetical protein